MGLFARAASLAAVPVKSGARFATAATATAFGADKDTAYGNAMQASVESLTSALAKARGPALKFGQILALFSSTLPPEQAAMLASLERLYDFQHADGGWGWWKEGDSDAYMTAYVVWGLSLAKDAGRDIRGGVLDRGLGIARGIEHDRLARVVESEVRAERQHRVDRVHQVAERLRVGDVARVVDAGGFGTRAV